jgi:hypothetical protein
MAQGFFIHRYLDPADSLGEVLFGLIMVLTFTVGASLVIASEGLDARELVVAAVGCNVAWGVIDAMLFLLGGVYHRGRRARFYRKLKSAGSEAEALAAVQDEFGLEDEPLAARPEDRLRLYQAILAIGANAGPARTGLRQQDFVAAFIVFVLVSATAIPGVIPFLLFDDHHFALRLSNAVLLVLLFIAGYWWAHYTDAHPWRVGTIVAVMGLCLVLVAVALGG